MSMFSPGDEDLLIERLLRELLRYSSQGSIVLNEECQFFSINELISWRRFQAIEGSFLISSRGNPFPSADPV